MHPPRFGGHAVAVARFLAKPACIGDSTRFQDVSAFLPDRSITTWDWVFNDPTQPGLDISNDRNPGYAYALPSSYTVQLTVTAASGCTSTYSKKCGHFTPAQQRICHNACCMCGQRHAVQMDGVSAQPAMGFWRSGFGGKKYRHEQPKSTTTTRGGVYTVTAVPRNAYGCTASYTQSVTIAPNNLTGTITPATPAQICEGKTLSLTAPLVPGAAYQWSNGSLSSSITVSETGVYRVTVTSVDGCILVPPARNLNVAPAPDGTIKALEINSLGQVTGVSFPSLTVCQGFWM